MERLYIIGAGGLGREVAWVVERINSNNKTWELMGFLDDNDDIQGQEINGYPVVGNVDYLRHVENSNVICAIGNAKIKENVISRVKEIAPQVRFATLIDPDAVLSQYVSVGEGTIICAHTIVTVNVTIGEHVYINLGCTVGHDAVIDDYVSVMPGANISGKTHVGRSTEIGTGSQIIQGLRVVPNVILGAGAVVVRNIEEEGTYIGAPAKKIKS